MDPKEILAIEAEARRLERERIIGKLNNPSIFLSFSVRIDGAGKGWIPENELAAFLAE